MEENYQYEIKNRTKSDSSNEILDLAMKFSLSEPINKDDIQQWINTDEQQEITNNEMKYLLTSKR